MKTAEKPRRFSFPKPLGVVNVLKDDKIDARPWLLLRAAPADKHPMPDALMDAPAPLANGPRVPSVHGPEPLVITPRPKSANHAVW